MGYDYVYICDGFWYLQPGLSLDIEPALITDPRVDPGRRGESDVWRLAYPSSDKPASYEPEPVAHTPFQILIYHI